MNVRVTAFVRMEANHHEGEWRVVFHNTPCGIEASYDEHTLEPGALLETKALGEIVARKRDRTIVEEW